MKDTTIYKKGRVFKPGDMIYVNFNTPLPSKFKVVESNKRKNILKVKVLVDFYKEPYEYGEIIDIGKVIFEQYWFFKHCRKGKLV